MGGRHIAVVVSILVWILGYIFSLFFFSNRYSQLGFVKSIGEKYEAIKLKYSLFLIQIFSPIVAAQAYRIGGIFELGNGIFWGCYIEDFEFITGLMLFLSLVFLLIFLLIGLINPDLIGFSARLDVLKWYLLHHLYVILLWVITFKLIPILSGPLSGKDGSCW